MALSLILNQEDHTQESPASPPLSSRGTPVLSDVEGVMYPPAKKQKVAKDAAVFVQHEIRAPIRYKPWESYDPSTERELKACGGKSGFEEKTGRKAFEVYQYTFTLPGTQKCFVVMWDYNIGLVRITPFFKSLGHGKTIPSKAIDGNEGLRDLCFSITGGALAAQGYWMPFEAAKAMAQTFCHPIRYALAPLFGPDFARQCIRPNDEGFEKSRIDPKIVRRCAVQAEENLRQETEKRARTTTPQPGTLNPFPEPISRFAASTPESHDPYGSGRWHAVNSESEESTTNSSVGKKPYLPSPSSITFNGPPRSTPRQVTKLPLPAPMLTSAALKLHERGTSWTSNGDRHANTHTRTSHLIPSNSDGCIESSPSPSHKPTTCHGGSPRHLQQQGNTQTQNSTSAQTPVTLPRVSRVESVADKGDPAGPEFPLESIPREELLAAWALVKLARQDALTRLRNA